MTRVQILNKALSENCVESLASTRLGNPVYVFNQILLLKMGTLGNLDNTGWREFVKPLAMHITALRMMCMYLALMILCLADK